MPLTWLQGSPRLDVSRKETTTPLPADWHALYLLITTSFCSVSVVFAVIRLLHTTFHRFAFSLALLIQRSDIPADSLPESGGPRDKTTVIAAAVGLHNIVSRENNSR